MSFAHEPACTWVHTDAGLGLFLERRIHGVPRAIAGQLSQSFPAGLTLDPVDDLLELERCQRLELTDAAKAWEQTETRLAGSGEKKPRSRGLLAEPSESRDPGLVRHQSAAQRLHHTRVQNRLLRRWIISLEVRTGRLAETRRGWLLSPETPCWITATWSSIEAFLDADTRRAVRSSWGAGTVNSEIIGRSWRRDTDDNAEMRYDQSPGAWTIGYIQTTDEIYAQRICAYRPDLIWLLGSGRTPLLIQRLHELAKRTREPNSLIHAASTVRNQQHRGLSAKRVVVA